MILIGNGILITRDNKNTIIENGAVLIENNIIKEIGVTENLKEKYSNFKYEYIDAKKRLIMPGFINAHMHYYSSFARGMATDSPPATMFSQILKGLWWRLDKKLTISDVYYSALVAMIEEIKCGVTTSIDHHASPYAAEGSLFKIAEAAVKLGIRRNLCYETSDRDGIDIKNIGIKENIAFIKYCKEKKDDMLTGMFGLHASMTISDKTMDECIDAAKNINAGFHIHVAEGIEDVADSLSKYNMRVVERLYKKGVLNEKSIAVHCIHVTEDEKEMLKDSKVSIVHNPESNMGNAVGVSPVIDFIKRGILVGMGTDGYTNDVTESYKVSNILHKHANKLPCVGWVEPPKMLFDNNRLIIGKQINGEVGILKENAYADIIIVDYNPITPLNSNNLNGHILFGVSGRNVDTTIVNGKIIYNERKLVNIDENEIMKKSRELSRKLWERI